MNTFLTVLFTIILIILLLGIIYIYLYNKINDSMIRITESENRIDEDLRNKYDILNRSVAIIKGKIELDDNAFNELAKLKTKKISNFDLDRVLVGISNELMAVYDNNKELRDSDELYKSIRQIESIDEELITLRKYYNDNIADYNKMIKSFPALIIAKIKGYTKKLFYDLKDRDDKDYEDFKL